MRFRILHRPTDADTWVQAGFILFPEPKKDGQPFGSKGRAWLVHALEGLGLYAPRGLDVLSWCVVGAGTCSFTIYDADAEPFIVGAGLTVSAMRDVKKDRLRKKVLARLNKPR